MQGEGNAPLTGGIVVFGAGGFLGGHLAVLASALGLERNLPVCCVAHGTRVETRPPASGPRLEAVRAELVGEAEELLDELKPQAVLNAVALSSLEACSEEPDAARCLNVDFPARLARWAERSDARFVHVSTDLVFGGDPPRESGYVEEDAVRPLSAYGSSKARGEEATLAANPLALVVRLPLLYGLDAPGSFGAGPARARGASESLLQRVRAGGRARLFRDEFRTPLDVESAARGLLELVDRGERGLLHVAGPDRLSRLALGELCLRAVGLSGEALAARIEDTTRAEAGPDFERERPADVSLDASRARALLRTELASPAEVLLELYESSQEPTAGPGPEPSA